MVGLKAPQFRMHRRGGIPDVLDVFGPHRGTIFPGGRTLPWSTSGPQRRLPTVYHRLHKVVGSGAWSPFANLSSRAGSSTARQRNVKPRR